MTTMTADRYTAVDVNKFRPDDLLTISDDDFHAVVDADLRRKASRSSVTLRDDLIAGLRTAEVAPRWHASLVRKQKSIEGQLSAKECDFQAERAQIELEITRLSDKAARGAPCRDSHTGTVMSADEIAEALESLRLRLHTLRVAHMKGKAGRIRFKTGLDEMTIEARYLRDASVQGLFRSAIAAERDYHASYARQLEAAIETHRKVVSSADDDVPDGTDETLWSFLRTTTEPVSNRENNREADAGRDTRTRRP